jgi:aryl-alcohol dehydrogenase-like predicted oxidoreductase
MRWFPQNALRVGLGCMRLAEERAAGTIGAALDAGMTIFDTARAYGDSERLLAAAIRLHRAEDRVRIVTKGGMARPDGAWRADGRARTLRADCEASLLALDGIPIDLYLVHAPDPNTPWQTTVRALAALLNAGLVRNVGVCNVNRRQLDEALDLAPIAAVQVAFGPGADAALRGGVVARCAALALPLLAHSPFGGPARAGRLVRERVLAQIGQALGTSPHGAALAALVDLDPCIVPIVGATRPETARACADAVRLTLRDEDRAALGARFGWRDRLAPPAVTYREGAGEAVLLMGIQGAGKSTEVARWVARGFERLNRDARGGTLRSLHAMLQERLAAGAKVVLDNTYASRAQRQGAIEAARKAGARVRGVWLQTSTADAQMNVVLRMIATHGRLLEPHEMRRARDPSALPPHALFRTVREVEPPSPDEGFDSLETVPFVRRARERGVRGRFVALDAVFDGLGKPRGGAQALLEGADACLVFGWRPAPAGFTEVAQAAMGALARVACCPHPAGPPQCWCRPPLPGLPLAFAEEHGIDLARSVVVGTGAAHETLARTLGARYEVSPFG